MSLTWFLNICYSKNAIHFILLTMSAMLARMEFRGIKEKYIGLYSY